MRRWPYYVAAVVFVVLGYIMGWVGKDVLVIPSFLSAVVCAAIANLDRIKSVKASTSGIEAVLNEARGAVKESRTLALVTSKMLLSLVKRTGRLGPYPDEQQNEIKLSVDRVLAEFDTTDKERKDVYSDWHKYVLIDYVFGILGGNVIPEKIDSQEMEAWRELRHRAGETSDLPAPDEIETFLQRNGFLSPERAELIEDFRYYKKHLHQRRPDIWAKREKWSQALQR